MKNYVNKITGAAELNRVARENGYKNWQTAVNKISESFNSLGLEGEAAKKFDLEKKESMQFLLDIADMLLGNYGRLDNPKLAKGIDVIKCWNRVTQLGYVTVSSLPDVSILNLRYGLKKTTAIALNDISKNKIFDEQAMNKVLACSEVEANMGRVLDETFTYGGKGRLGKLEKVFHLSTGLPYWNTKLKRISAIAHYDSILEAALKNDAADQLFLRQHRISASLRDKIVKFYNSYGYELENGVKCLPLDRIEDKTVFNALRESIQTAVNETVLTPGIGDVPRFFRGKLGSALFQYRSFIMTFHTNVFMPALMQTESRKHLSDFLTSAAALGIVSSYLHARLRRRKPDYSSLDFWENSFKYSGLGSYIFDTANDLSYVFRRGDITTVSPQIQLGNKAIGFIKAVHKGVFTDKRLSENDIRKLSRLAPIFATGWMKTFVVDPQIRQNALSSGRKLVKDYSFLGLE